MSKPVIELPVAADLSTPDGLRQHTRDITARLNELAIAQAKGRFVTEDEWQSVDEGIKQLGARTHSIDEMLKSQAANYAGGSDAFSINRAALRLDLPDDMSKRQRDYFNFAVLRWDELANLSHLGESHQRYIGLSRNVATAGSSTNSARLRDTVDRFQHLNDELLVLDTLMHPHDSRAPDLGARLGRMAQYKNWPEYMRIVNELCTAMKVDPPFARATIHNEASGSVGLPWVPTILSAQLMDLVQVWSKVAPLFTPVTMTSKTLDWPVLGGDLTAAIMTEATDDAATPIGSSTATTNKVTFTAQKLGVRTFASTELIEDAIVPMVPFLISNSAKVLARGIEDALINGEAGTTMDGATFNPSGGPKRLWKGLRFYALKTASYPAAVDGAAAATFVSGPLLDVQSKMGAWGANPAPLAWITGFHGYRALKGLTELITLDKFGPQATILSGQVGNIFGSPVILSEFVTEKDATGVHNATAANNVKGSILCVHMESFGLATRRGINVAASSDRYIEVDQTVFIATTRQDFQPFYTPAATVTPVGILYNIL